MGYSNNKWRKLLTILMIINLCFVLFAKITKSSGDFSVTYDSIDIPVTDSLINTSPYYAIFASETRYDYSDASGYYFFLVRSNSPIKAFVRDTTANRLICYSTNNTGLVSYLSFGSLDNKGFPVYMANTSFTTFSNTTESVGTPGYSTNWTCLYTNYDIVNYNDNDEILFPNDDTLYPYFENITEIEDGYPDGVFIRLGDYSKDDNLYFHLLKVNSSSVPTPGNSVFYYSDNLFKLNKDSSYYQTFEEDTDEKYAYYYIPRYKLSFDMDTSYVYVLTSSPDIINNSYNHIEKDISNGFYDVVESDTTGLMTSVDEQSDKLKSIEEETIAQTNNSNNISNSLTNTTPDSDISTDIDSSLNFNNQNDGLNNLNNGFFSRLTTMLSNLLGYNLAEDTSVSIPLPNSNKSIILHSKDIYDNVTGVLRLIINAFWVYIFSFYMWKFINKIYIAVSTGNILDTFSSSGEAITNDML